MAGGQAGKIFKTVMDPFDHIWHLLAPQGEYCRRQAACRRLWEGYDLETQRLIYRRIHRKLQVGEYVSENPYYAIADNSYEPRKPGPVRPPETIFLHGRPLFDAMNDHIPLVQVDIPDRHEGRYPVCTRADAEKYGLTIYKDF